MSLDLLWHLECLELLLILLIHCLLEVHQVQANQLCQAVQVSLPCLQHLYCPVDLENLVPLVFPLPLPFQALQPDQNCLKVLEIQPILVVHLVRLCPVCLRFLLVLVLRQVLSSPANPRLLVILQHLLTLVIHCGLSFLSHPAHRSFQLNLVSR